MRNNKKSRDKEKLLAERKRLEKKKLVLQLKKEIDTLEAELENAKVINNKRRTMRSIKIILRLGQLIAPYTVTAGLIFSGFAALGCTPFYRDNRRQNLEVRKDVDSLGNIRYEEQYDDYGNVSDTIANYGKWDNIEEGFYHREIVFYDIGAVTEEAITKIVNENDVTSLEDLFGEPLSKKDEYRNNLSEDEIQADAYLQATFYDEVENKYIVFKESVVSNRSFTLFWALMTISSEYATYLLRKKTNFNFSKSIKRIKKNYPIIDTQELKRKLEIKKDNYDRFMR